MPRPERKALASRQNDDLEGEHRHAGDDLSYFRGKWVPPKWVPFAGAGAPQREDEQISPAFQPIDAAECAGHGSRNRIEPDLSLFASWVN